MNTILIVDSTNNFLRNYAVVPTLTRNGAPNGGVYGFLNSLRYFIRIIKPNKVILVWDGEGGSKKRRAIMKEYKKGRKPARLNRNFEHEFENVEENKTQQRRRIGQYLSDLPVTQIIVDDIEADDVIGYLTMSANDGRKVIVSSDKDFYQLLSEKTIIFSPIKKKFITSGDVIKEFKIHPVNFALARAIIGDNSDNLKGIKGVGFKTVFKYFPFFCHSGKVQLDHFFSYCEKEGDKYTRFLENKEIIINNLKVMKLDATLISSYSMDKINESLEKPLHLNGTSFRLKLYEDGIASIDDSYLQSFRSLQVK
jgi:5'-3' exonuclease